MNEIELLKAKIGDKIEKSRNEYVVTTTDFLDLNEQSIAEAELNKYRKTEKTASGEKRKCREFNMVGGYEDAERRLLICLPDYVESLEEAVDEELCVIRISLNRHEKEQKHGNYLGSLMGLKIKRGLLGDILVREDGADVIAHKSISDFVKTNLLRVGSASVAVEILPISELLIPEGKMKEVGDTVASLRLDNVVASAFKISRQKAKDMIGQGLCFVNHVQKQKTDAEVKEGDVINLRHFGKIKVSEVGNVTRKGRIFVKFMVYM